jgi:hypothetical protein
MERRLHFSHNNINGDAFSGNRPDHTTDHIRTARR